MSTQDTRDRYRDIAGDRFGRGTEWIAAGAARPDDRLERLIERLPPRWQRTVGWLRRPSARWARIPGGILLIFGGFLAILPIFGLWMIPLGLVLLAEDVPLLGRLRERTLAWLERRWPQLFVPPAKQSSDKEETR